MLPRVVRHLGRSVWPGSAHLTTIISEAIDGFPLRFDIRAAKVTDASVESKIDKDVFWLQISVDDACVVNCGEARCLKKSLTKYEDGGQATEKRERMPTI